MFEAAEFIEVTKEPAPRETHLGEFQQEMVAVEAARAARLRFMDTGSDDYAWWVVRKPGARLAHFIAVRRATKNSSST